MSAAQYLLRFDDICPTMNWSLWAEIEAILIRRRLRPILAVVPDNQDPVLQVDSPAKDFWDRVRGWRDRGWPIALHGFQHRYASRNAGLVARRKLSEFAGLPETEQREKLQRGMEIFHREGIGARVWVAPGNTFDETTVALLPQFGIDTVSAGYFQLPFVCPLGLTWIPQQMHYFRSAPHGVWTVCYHHNSWDKARMSKFREDAAHYEANIVSLEHVLNGNTQRESRWSPWLCRRPRLAEFLIRLELKLWSCWSRARTQIQAGSVKPVGA